MKTLTLLLAFSIGLVLVMPAASLAAETYTASLAAADTALGAGNADRALRELNTALDQAANPGERALALAKKAYVLAFNKQMYGAAQAALNEAFEIPMEPVAEVTALQAQAECQMKAKQDYHTAAVNLQKALELPGVEWAHPGLAMSLADCHRETGQLDDALENYQRVTEMPDASYDLKAGAFLNIGFIYQYDRKDAAAARNAYGRAAALRPGLQEEVDKHLADLPQ